MGVKVGELIGNLLKKSGYKIDDASLKDVSGITIELSQDAADHLEKELLPVATAHMNATVRGAASAEVLNGADAVLETLMKDFKLDDATIADLKGEKTTFKRIEKLTKKIADLKEKEAAAKTGQQKEDVTKLKEEYENKLQKTVQEYEGKITTERQTANGRILNKSLTNYLGTKPYVNKDLPNVDVSLTLINKELADKGAKLVLAENDELQLVQLADEKLPYRDDKHNPVTAAQFIDRVLLDKKLVSVAGPEPPGSGGSGKPSSKPIIPGGEGGARGLEDFQEKVNASLADFSGGAST